MELGWAQEPPCLCVHEPPQPLAWGPVATALMGPAVGQQIDSGCGWATCGGGGTPKLELTFPASLKGTGTRNGVKWEAPAPGRAQFQGHLGVRGKGSAQGLLVLQESPSNVVHATGCGKIVHSRLQRASQRQCSQGSFRVWDGNRKLFLDTVYGKVVSTSSFPVSISSFFLNILLYFSLFYFVHPCGCHSINSCVFYIFM